MREVSSVPALGASLRAIPRVAWILYAGSFINRFGSFVMVFLVVYVTKLGHPPAVAGLALGAYGFGHLFASAAGGVLADRIGRRRTIALSMFCSAASVMLLSQAEQLPWVIGLSVLTGFSAELYRPASSAMLADLTATGERLTAFTLYRLAINLGFALGPATAGFLAERSFFYVFLGDAITSAAFGIIALIALPDTAGPTPEPGQESKESFFRVVIADRPFLAFLAASVAGTFVFFQAESSFPLHVAAAGFSNSVYGALISINGIVIVLFELLATRVTGRFDPRAVLAIGYALVGAGFAFNLIATTIPLMAVGVLIWTVGEIACAPVAGAYVADLAPPHLRGRYMGTWALTWSLGLMLGPSIGTVLLAWNPSVLWILCGVLGLTSAAISWFGPTARREYGE